MGFQIILIMKRIEYAVVRAVAMINIDKIKRFCGKKSVVSMIRSLE